MPWLITTDEVPASWPARCVGCAAPDPGGRIKAYGERLKSSIGVAHMFERLCVELPWCARCAGRASVLLVVGIAPIVVPWLLLTVSSFEPSISHLVKPRILVHAAFLLNGLGLLALGLRYWFTRPVRLLAGKVGLRGFVIRQRAVAEELAARNGLVLERRWLPKGW